LNLFLWNAETSDGRRYQGVLSASNGFAARESLLEKLREYQLEVSRFDFHGVKSKSFDILEVVEARLVRYGVRE
jgi:hypothetical protein